MKDACRRRAGIAVSFLLTSIAEESMNAMVSDVMTRDLYAVAPDTSIETAARLLSTRHIGGAPVVDRRGKAIGVISLFDLVDPDRPRTRRTGHPVFYKIHEGRPEALGDDVRIGHGEVSDVMSPFVLSIDASASLEIAARLMIDENVHRLLVVDGERLVGIVTTTDLLRGLIDQAA
jgi:CBS domain-containing protein